MNRGAVLGPLILSGLLGCDRPAGRDPAAETLVVTEIARFGSVDAPGAALSNVRDVAQTDSTILILESDPPRIAVFAPNASWRRDIGRRGDGPGELRCPSHMVATDGAIWVRDPCGQRLEVFRPDGIPVRSHRWVIQDTSEQAVLPGVPLRDGSVIAFPNLRRVEPRPMVRPFIRASADGEVVQRLYRWVQSERDVVTGEADGVMFFGLHPLPVSPVIDVFRDGSGLLVIDRLAAAESSFRMRVINAEGVEEMALDVPYEPRSADDWLTEWIELRGLDGSAAPFVGAFDARSFLPPVSGAVAGDDGSIWLRREGVLGLPARWEAYGPTGQLVGGVELPGNVQVLAATLEELWAVELDDVGVPFVIRYRVG